MKFLIKKYLSVVLCIAMVLCSTLPLFANANEKIESIDSQIVEQLKKDLGEEKTNEILNSSLETIIEEESDNSDYYDENLFEEENEEFEEGLIVKNLEDEPEKEPEEDLEEDLIEEEPEEDINKVVEIEAESEEKLDENYNVESEEETANTITEEITINDINEDSIIETNEALETDLLIDESETSIDSNNTVNDTIEKIDEEISIATISEVLEQEGIQLFGEAPLFGSGNSYILIKEWAAGSGIEKYEVTKLIFQKGGSVPSGSEYNIGSSGLKGYLDGTEITIYIPNADDKIYAPEDSRKLFSAYETGAFNTAPQMALTEIENLDYLNTDNVISMHAMFLGCSNLSSINLSTWDTSNVEDFGNMFYNCSNISSIDLSNFDTSNAIDFGAMFENCSSLINIDISNFDYSKADCSDSTVTGSMGANASHGVGLGHMFWNCSNLVSINMGNVNSSICRNFSGLFSGCSSLTNLIYTGFDVSSAISINYMFKDCSSLSSIDLSAFNTSNVKYASFLFFGCSGLTNLNININTNSLLSMLSMFYGCSQLTTINLSSFNTSAVTNMINTFKNCSNLQTIKVSTNFVISNVTSDDNMFYGCTSLVGGNGTPFDSSHIDKEYARIDTDSASGYFTNGDTSSNEYTLNANWYPTSGVNGITKGLVTKIKFLQSDTEPSGTSFVVGFNSDNTKNLNAYINGTEVTILIPNGATLYSPSDSTSLFSMYDGGTQFSSMTKSLTSIENLNLLNTSNVINMKSMFRFNSNLVSLDISSFDTSNVTNMSDMFGYCQSISSIDVSTFDTSNVTDMSRMFQEMRGLTAITLGSIDTSAVNKMRAMFQFCNSLTDIDLIEFNTSNVTDMWGMFDNDNVLTTIYVSTNFVTTSVIDSSQMFNNCSSIVGEAGTSYDSTKIDKTYARIDTAGTPGYFTEGNLGTLNSISVKTAPTKANYIAGDNFDPTGLVLTLSYDSGKSKSLSYNTNTSSDFNFEPSLTTALVTSNTSVTITYGGFDCTQTITVKELSSITVNTPPTKVSYREGECFNPAGLVINLEYSDSSTDIVSYAGNELDFSFSPDVSTELTASDTNVTITYFEKTCTQAITIVTLDSISVLNAQTKSKYKIGEFYNPAGLKICLTYTDLTTEEVTYTSGNATDFTFTPNETTPLEMINTSVTIGYAGKSCTQNITIKELSSITLKTNPTKLSYATGQSLNPNGLVITLNYTNYTISGSTPEAIDVTYNSSTQSKFSFNPSGTSISTGAVTVIYDGKTGASMQPTFNITVKTIASISVASRPSKVSYYSGDSLNPSGLSIKVNYTDNTNETIIYSSSNSSDFAFSPSGSLSTSVNAITVTYGGNTSTFAISVTTKPSNSSRRSGGSGGGGGGGGGGAISGGQGINPFTQSSGTTNTQATAKISSPRILGTEKTANSATSEWVKNADGSWGLNSNGITINNGFLIMTTMDAATALITNNTYHFDETGKMTVGWLKDTNGTFYFFEDAKTANEGKMCFGWKQMSTGVWYYFGTDGKMLAGQMTPDGYMLNADGSWVNPNVDSNIQTTYINTNSGITESFGSSGRTESNIEMKGPAAK